MKNKITAEDFVGWKSDDGLLEVVGIHGKQRRITTFKVICNKCSKDKELFPFGYFVSTKRSLENKVKPCGCSKRPSWTKEQFLILADRAGEEKFIVHGFAEEFHGAHTKLNLECVIDGNKWCATISHIINTKVGCPKCSNKYRLPEEEATSICTDLCKEKGYTFVGFPYGYKNIKSKVEFICLDHGTQLIDYSNFIKTKKGCRGCLGKTLSESQRKPIDVVLEKCKERCKDAGYDFLGFVSEYENRNSRIEYMCKTHGVRQVSYRNFVERKQRCILCTKDESNLNGYYHDRKGEIDYLYILNFNGKFVKVGRSFDIDERMKGLRTESKISIKKIHKLRIFTATHQEVYDTEQALLEELRERGFQYHLNWTKECFENECLYSLNKLLDICGLQELSIE